MAVPQSSPLPQYYGQKLQDGTVIESPMPPQHGRRSSDSRHELLRLPMQPHPAHIDQNVDPMSPVITESPNEIGIAQRTSNRRLGGQADPNDYGTPSRHQRSYQSQDGRYNSTMSHRMAYVEDYPSDEDYEPQPYRRRPTRQHRPPPSAFGNDPRMASRYTSVPGRASIDNNHPSYNNDKPQYHMHYGSDDEYAPRRPPLRVTGPGAGGGNEPPRRPPVTEDVIRLPWLIWMGSNAKNHFVAFVGEFVGTTMFLFFAFAGTQVANIGAGNSESSTTTGEATGFSPNVLLYIALVFSFSLMVNVWVFFRISGGLFNPAVTFAMMLVKAIPPVRAFMLLLAQIAGSIFSSYLVSVLFPTPFNVRTTLSTGTSLPQGVFIEAVLTAELVFTIFMLAKEKHKGKIPSLPSTLQLLANGVSSNVHCTRGHWPCTFHRGARGCVLHRRQSEPSSLIRPMCRYRHLRQGALDLLGRTSHWSYPRCAILQVHQDP